jgi:ABC-type molybdate transport system substrate-binding protein
MAALAGVLLSVLVGAAPAGAQELIFSVAISMKEAVEDLGRRFAHAHPGVTLRYNVGASGDLQKQIEAGAPVDLFVSAASRQMDQLEKKGLIVRQALDYVARGEVDAGFVYTTDDAARGFQIQEAFRPAEDTYPPVLYPAAVVAGSKQAALAHAFIALLVSRDGLSTLTRLGFLPPPAGAR